MAEIVDLTGRVVLVTGGTRGVGRGIAARFTDVGATVVVCGRNEPEDAAPGAAFLTCDVRDADQVDALVSVIVEQHGRLDVVVNNAGGSPPAEAATASPRFTQRIIELNLLAPLYVSQAANRAMQQQLEGGSIINIASLSGIRPSPGTTAYGAAKAGLISATQSLAQEWAPMVRVNAVVVGLVRTEQAELFYGDESAQARVAATVPIGRFAEPTDVGDVCLFLASPLAAYVTGAAIEAHGGGERPPFLGAAEG